jgi:Ca2+-binding EF-hand superfamily protein
MECPLDKEQIAILKKAFDTFAQGNTFITPDVVGSIFRMMGTAFTEETLQETIAEIDEDGSGQIEFEEFTILAAKFIVEEDDEDVQKELKEAFRLYDKEGQGYITTAVLKQILHEIDDKLTEEELDGMIDEIDEDGSGTVDFDEFMEMMTG